MSYDLEEIAKELKAAREAKGLSQRALSAKVDIPQSHLSKIEAGLTDIRLSSLIQIARALDLEISLVPKKALPVVNTVVRSAISSTPDKATLRARESLNRIAAALFQLTNVYPDPSQILQTKRLVEELKTAHVTETAANELKSLERYFEELAVKANKQKASGVEKGVFAFESHKYAEMLSRLKALRNHLVHQSMVELHPRANAAYRLEDDDNA